MSSRKMNANDLSGNSKDSRLNLTMSEKTPPEIFAEQLASILDSLLADCHLEVKAERDAFGLSAAQYQAMLALEEGPRTMQQIAKSILASPSTATRVIDQLVRSGHARRLTNETDRRAIWIRLTPKGARRLRQVKDMRLQNAHDILRQIEPAEWEQLLKSLSKLEAASRACHVAALQRSLDEQPSESAYERRLSAASRIVI